MREKLTGKLVAFFHESFVSQYVYLNKRKKNGKKKATSNLIISLNHGNGVYYNLLLFIELLLSVWCNHHHHKLHQTNKNKIYLNEINAKKMSQENTIHISDSVESLR